MTTSMEKKPTVILLSNDGMGNAEPELQHRLITAYLTLLNEYDILPSVICFFTQGVKLVVEGSPVLDLLSSLEEKGVWLIVCHTCLNYFGLQDKLKVGFVGGMGDILEAQWRAEKVITL
ncbi:MAG TPA: sulfurtransferase-like selenium metabolism protein YedF [Anaerolineae bacterium]|nr:sulfurtransferase-like selenium metabolism protein YedF [Anaerolineae bacterium]